MGNAELGCYRSFVVQFFPPQAADIQQFHGLRNFHRNDKSETAREGAEPGNKMWLESQQSFKELSWLDFLALPVQERFFLGELQQMTGRVRKQNNVLF